jgi:hypothetical protein
MIPLVGLLVAAGPAPAQPPPPDNPVEGEEPKGPTLEAGTVEVRFTDGGTLRLVLLDEKLELETRYGKLLIPVKDLQRVEFALRVPEEVERRVGAAVADLGSPIYRVREAAGVELLALREKAYPALVRASRQADKEVAHRAQDLVKKLRDTLPEELLAAREYDVVTTEDSKFTGRVTAAALRVRTAQFGEQRLRLADVFSLRSPAAAEPEHEPKNVLPDPGSLKSYEGQVGMTLAFRVTGAVATGGLWGTDVYTTDSSLAMAAVHAGVLRVGQTGVVRVTILGPHAGFTGSTRHGVTSSDYGIYPGSYRVKK